MSEMYFSGMKDDQELLVVATPDDMPDNPLEHWGDDAPLLIVKSNRYLQGPNEHQQIKALLDDLESMGYNLAEDPDFRELHDDLRFGECGAEDLNRIQLYAYDHLIAQPVYQHTHSGTTVSMVNPGCDWDSGQIGWFVWPFNRVRSGYPSSCGPHSKFTGKLRREMSPIFHTYFRVWQAYVEGDVWDIRLYEPSDLLLCLERPPLAALNQRQLASIPLWTDTLDCVSVSGYDNIKQSIADNLELTNVTELK